jgi:nucleoside-diphosphate-sugar epimerase
VAHSPIVVIGAGYVGKRLLQRLDDSDNIELGRSSSLDLDSDQALPVMLPRSYCLLYTVPPSPKENHDKRLESLLGMLPRSPQRIIYISTTGVYGDHRGALVNEQSALLATSDRAKRRLSAESLLLSWTTERDVALTILRTPGIYGPARLGIECIKNRDSLICESDAHPGNRIHVEDIVSCCIAALRGDAPADIYNIGDGDHRSPTFFSKEVARQAGLEMPPEVSREKSGKQAAESRVVDTTRMREQLGVIPKYANAEDGIRASLKETGVN